MKGEPLTALPKIDVCRVDSRQGANAGNLNARYTSVAYGQLMAYVKDARHGTNASALQQVTPNH